MSRRRRAVRLGLLVAAPVLFVLCLKVFLLDVYRVDSGSMEPTIRGGGELVLVRYGRAPELERFELAVILREGEREPAVKRVVGLPGEEVRIMGGDLLIDGAKLGAEVERPRPVLVFDSERHDMEEHFEYEPDKAWSQRHGGVTLESEELALASWSTGLTDDLVLADGARIVGETDVGDARLSLRVVPRTESVVLLSLSEKGDRFEAELELADDSECIVRFVRHPRGEEPVALTDDVLTLDVDRWHHIAFSNVDDHLALDVDGRRVLAVSYGSNTPLGGTDPRHHHLRPRASFGGRGDRLRFGHVQLHRDLHYTERGTFGVTEPVRLGPGEIFVLGDNSSESVDGREWGAVSLEEVIGVPVAIPWPLASARRLDPLARIPDPPSE